MGLLMDRARRVFGGGAQEPPPAEPFEVVCACGQRAAGVRRDHRQFLTCSRCGATLFVLPQSCYPMPAVLRQVSESSPAFADEIDEPRPRRPLGVRMRLGLRRARRGTAAGLSRLVPPARWFSAGRLLLAAMFVAVVGTTVLTVYLSRRSGLVGEIAAAREACLAELENGDFNAARAATQPALRSLKRYAGRDHEFRDFEQLAREVAIFADLLESPLEKVIDDARTMRGDETARHFRETLRGPSLVLDAVLVAVPPGDSAGASRLVCRLFVGNEPARVDARDFVLLTKPPTSEVLDVPRRVLFGARIQTIERDADDNNWIIRLIPDSGVWITRPSCMEKIGWPLDAATQTLLEEQGRWATER